MMNRQEIDYLSQSLANKYFIANVILRNVSRGRVQQGQGGAVCPKVPLIIDVVCAAVILFWVVVLGGTLLLSILGLIMLVFQID